MTGKNDRGGGAYKRSGALFFEWSLCASSTNTCRQNDGKRCNKRVSVYTR